VAARMFSEEQLEQLRSLNPVGGFSAWRGLLSSERPGGLSMAGVMLTVPAIVAVSVSTGRQASSPADGSGAAAESPGHDSVPDANGRTGMSQAGCHTAGVVCGLAAGAGFGCI
jgi:hypothetical protein